VIVLKIEAALAQNGLDRIHVALRAAGEHFALLEIRHLLAEQCQVQPTHRPAPFRVQAFALTE
jgi:hypothetical protein